MNDQTVNPVITAELDFPSGIGKISNTIANRVGVQIHAINLEFVDHRDKWRRQYKLLSQGIRELKRALAEKSSPGKQHALDLLRQHALVMMMEREEIGRVLKKTSHKWV